MRSILRGSAAIGAALVLAACSGGSNPPPSVPASQAGTPAAATCQDTTDPGTVQATVAGFKWSAVSAKVGDVVTWTNSDSAPHAVALDDGSCAMSGNIAAGGGTRSLKFNVAGSFPFHCSIHSSMKGTITIS
jgi:plastocyanin